MWTWSSVKAFSASRDALIALVAVGDVADLSPTKQFYQPREDRDADVAGARVAAALRLAHPARSDDEVRIVADDQLDQPANDAPRG